MEVDSSLVTAPTDSSTSSSDSRTGDDNREDGARLCRCGDLFGEPDPTTASVAASTASAMAASSASGSDIDRLIDKLSSAADTAADSAAELTSAREEERAAAAPAAAAAATAAPIWVLSWPCDLKCTCVVGSSPLRKFTLGHNLRISSAGGLSFGSTASSRSASLACFGNRATISSGMFSPFASAMR